MTNKADSPDFASLLRVDSRWPTRGDKPFKVSDRRQDNSSIDTHGHGRLVMMMAGYKKAADIMVRHAENVRYDGDALIYPIIFNYRHFIELSLKYLIATFGKSVNVDAKWDTHDLTSLWSVFVEMLRLYGVRGHQETDTTVAAIVTEFARVDPKSFSYRYPVDKNGNPLNLNYQEIDLTHLSDIMSGIENYFNGCDGYLDSKSFSHRDGQRLLSVS